ncbi:MAG: M23 family metallopeptidase [Spirochaetota bacterium]|nr:MAG: M23 family metallopeptidase [Spirochaetota bacterium]
MNRTLLFVDSQRQIETPSIDKKKELIQNQRISIKKKRLTIPEKERGTLSQVVLLKSIYMKKGLLFIIGSVLLVLFFLFPLFLDMKSYFWERQRVIYKEDDLVYNLFLMQRVDNIIQQRVEDHGKDFIIPSLTLMSYRVTKGDSLFGLARKFNVSVDSIITANDLKNAYYLQIGTELKIPNMSGVFYTVKEGDNLSSIAKRYNANITSIADINDLDSSVIHVRQRLFVPGGSLTEWERASAIGEIFKRPVRGRLTSRMGFRIDPFTKKRAYHTGIDIGNRIGAPVYASQFGRVMYTGYRGNYGRTVMIVHPQGYETLYAHLDKIFVKKGQAVQQGEKIGSVGNSGRTTGPHLHFEVHQNGKLVDPLKVIKLR